MTRRKFDIAEWEEKLKNGADINKPDAEGWTALYYAIWAGSIRGIKFCVKHGADVNLGDDSGKTPLSYAVKYNAEDKIFEMLLASGANIENEDEVVKSAVAAFLEQQKTKLSANTQLRLFSNEEDKK